MAVNKRRPILGNDGCSCSMPGVWRAVAHNPGVAVIYHAPKACTHVTGTMDLYNYYSDLSAGEPAIDDYTAPLVATQIEEKHTIFGGAALLGKCIDYVAEHYRPEYIVVANSCVSGVIGDDSAGVCQTKEEELGIPIICVEGRGFLDGEYYGGFYEASVALIERFAKPCTNRDGGICVLGEKGGPYSRNAKDVRSLLEGFEIEVQQRFPAYASRQEIENLGSSRWTLPLGGSTRAYAWMEKLAKQVEKHLGVPYFPQDYPVGIAATYAWLEHFGTFIGRPELVENAQRLNRERLAKAMVRYGSKLEGQRALIIIAYRQSAIDVHWVLEMLEYAKIQLRGIMFLGPRTDELVAQVQKEERSRGIPIYFEHDLEITPSDFDMVLATTELELPGMRQLFLPMVPPIGIGGIIYLYEKLYRLVNHHGQRGVIVNGW